MGEANLLNALLSRNPIVTVHDHMSSLSDMRPALESFVTGALVR